MYLKKLCLSGFKSFADPTELVFDPGTTVVVGPNGCGKSNVVDAFRWVLGERSAKGLRGQEMLDVIFKGTRNRDPLSRAEVSLVFDNSDGRLPLEFNEVEVTRRLYRSGESEYLINRRKCRLKDVKRLFSDTGIGTEGYSILEQGSVDKFLHASPVDRRAIFEEAAGVSRYKEQKLQAMRQLERMGANLQRSRDILREVERRVRSVKIQAGKAQRFLEDRERLVRLRAVLTDSELSELRERRSDLTFRLSLLGVRRGVVSDALNGLDERRVEMKEAVEHANEAFTAVRDREMQLRMSLERLQQRRAHIAERVDDLAAAEEQRQEQRVELRGLEEEAEGRRQETRARTREEIAALREARRRFREVDARREELTAEKDALEKSTKESKEEVVSLLFSETRLSNERTAHESEHRGLEAMRERRINEGAEFEGLLAQQRAAAEELGRQRFETNRDAAEAASRCELIRAELERRGRLLNDSQRSLSELREALEKDQARLRFLEGLEESREGIGKGPRRLLTAGHPLTREIVGLLGSLIDAESDVAPMVDAVLDRYGETIVMLGDTPLADRARAVRELLDGEGVSFCHLGLADPEADATASPAIPPASSALSPAPHDGGVDGPGPRRTPLLDLIRCEPEHRDVLRRLFGDVYVVEHLDEAVALAGRPDNRRRYVTRDGTLVEPWGAVTLPASNGGGLVSRRAEIHQLQRDLERREQELRRKSDDVAALEMVIHARQGELRRLDEKRQRAELEAESLGRRLAAVEHEQDRLTQRLEVVQHEIEEIDDNRARIADELADVNERFEAIQARRVELEECIRGREDSLRRLGEQLDEVEPRVSALRVESTQKEERILALRREELRVLAELSERSERRRWLDEQDARGRERRERYLRETEELDEERERERERLASIDEEAEQARDALQARKEELESSERAAVELRRHDEELRARREEDLVAENECRMRITSLCEQFEAEFEQALDETPVGEWREALETERESEAEGLVLDELRDELTAVQERLRKNANVNLEAVNELEELEERQGFLVSQVDDLEGSQEKLVATIEELNQKSRSLFEETFAVVREGFQELFAKMFNGGVADLVLEEGVDILEAGVEVKARPPGKRISSLRLLSGGERALTAISVLFALFKTRPSPFCLLDEVDAPLDEANIRRFVRILEEFTDDTQFVIITHSKVTMAEGERLYGITMEEEGVSRHVAVRIDDVERLGITGKRRGKRASEPGVGDDLYSETARGRGNGSESEQGGESEETIDVPNRLAGAPEFPGDDRRTTGDERTSEEVSNPGGGVPSGVQSPDS